MEQYILKSTLVAEIKNRIKELQNLHKENEEKLDSIQKTAILLCIDECRVILSFIDTLEVKEVDLEKDVRKIIDLYFEAGKHYDDVIKKERNMYGYSDLAIKLLDRTADAKEMSIQYVLDKLKVQKGE